MRAERSNWEISNQERRAEVTGAGEGVQKRVPVCTADGNVN